MLLSDVVIMAWHFTVPRGQRVLFQLAIICSACYELAEKFIVEFPTRALALISLRFNMT